MSSNNGAREFPVETDFQRKARRPGGVTRNQAVGGAQAQIETLKDEFRDWVKDGLKRLQSSIRLAESEPANAKLICEVLDNIRNGADYDKVLIRCHLDALQLARQDSYKNVSPDQVPELCDGLRRAAERSMSLAGRVNK
jgi:hypothetical protein